MFNRGQAHNLAAFLNSVGVDCHVEYTGENLDMCYVEIDNEDQNFRASIENVLDLVLICKNRQEIIWQ